MKKKMIAVTLFIALALTLSASSAFAAEFIVPTIGGSGNVTVAGPGEHKNIYVAGGNVTVSTPVKGDLYVAGGTVSVQGSIDQDIVVAGGNIIVGGSVGGDLRGFTGTLNVTAPVSGDVLMAGGSMVFSDAAKVGGDFTVAGGDITVNAPIKGTTKIFGGMVRVNSKIEGDLTVRAAQQLVFGPNADVAGKVVYDGAKAAVLEKGAKVSSIKFTQLKEEMVGGDVLKFILGVAIIKLIAWIIAVLLIIKLMRKRVTAAVENMYKQPWMNLGVGILAVIVMPIIAILLLVTFIGYYVALLVMAWFFLAMLISALLAAIFLGSWIRKLWMKKTVPQVSWSAGVIGVIAMFILAFIPLLGWLACMVLCLMSFGAMVRMMPREMSK